MYGIRSRYLSIAALGAISLVCGVSASAASAGTGAPTPSPAPSQSPAPNQPAGASEPTGATIFVSPTGSDKAPGTAAAPLATLQAALNRATPGTTIQLSAGVYAEGGTTRHDGTPTQPIVIEGPRAGIDPTTSTSTIPTATLTSTRSHVLTIANSNYVLNGFSIDGQPDIEAAAPVSTWPAVGSSVATVTAFKNSFASVVRANRLLYIAGGATTPVQGTVVENMSLTGAGGECVRVRDDTSNTLITRTLIRWCGMAPRVHGGRYAYHNGEGVYIGTSPKSKDLANHTDDQTTLTSVVGDVIETFGSECFDVKENAHDNVLSNTTCEGNTEPVTHVGSQAELRGYDNRVSDNIIAYSAGAGVKIASDTAATDLGGNTVENNTIRQVAGAPIEIDASAAQGTICGNTMTAYAGSASNWTGAC